VNGIQILTRLVDAGISCRMDGNEIVLAPADLVTTEIKDIILANRGAVVAAIRNPFPEWCHGQACSNFETIDLPRRGPTPGCVIREPDQEIWRRLDRMTDCPMKNKVGFK